MNSVLSNTPALAFLAGPWLFLALMLSGPFLLLLTVFLVALALPLVAVLVAVPFVLARRRRVTA